MYSTMPIQKAAEQGYVRCKAVFFCGEDRQTLGWKADDHRAVSE
jgi:hypothetical protein